MFGGTSVKPLKLVGTASWLGLLEARINARPMAPGRVRLTDRVGRWVVGRREELSESASYPLVFCRMVACLQLEEQERRATAASATAPVIDID